jgi:hypothetical protein
LDGETSENFNQDEAMTFTKLEQKLTAALIHPKEAEYARPKAMIDTSDSHYAASELHLTTEVVMEAQVLIASRHRF